MPERRIFSWAPLKGARLRLPVSVATRPGPTHPARPDRPFRAPRFRTENCRFGAVGFGPPEADLGLPKAIWTSRSRFEAPGPFWDNLGTRISQFGQFGIRIRSSPGLASDSRRTRVGLVSELRQAGQAGRCGWAGRARWAGDKSPPRPPLHPHPSLLSANAGCIVYMYNYQYVSIYRFT